MKVMNYLLNIYKETYMTSQKIKIISISKSPTNTGVPFGTVTISGPTNYLSTLLISTLESLQTEYKNAGLNIFNIEIKDTFNESIAIIYYSINE